MSNFVQKGKIKVVNGSVALPHNTGLGFVVIPCDMSGNPSSNLFSMLGKKWGKVISEYKFWYPKITSFKLGNIHDTVLQSDAWAVYCLCKDKDGKLDKNALEACVDKLISKAKFEKASLHVSNLVISEVPEFADFLREKVVSAGVNVLLYDETK